MPYQIEAIEKRENGLWILVDWKNGNKGSVTFPQTATRADILAELNKMEANYTTIADARIPADIRALVGYAKP